MFKKSEKYGAFIAEIFNHISPTPLTLIDPILSNGPDSEEYQNGLNEFSIYLFKLTSTKSRKIITNRIYATHFDVELFNMVRVMSVNMNIDINHIFNFCDSFPVQSNRDKYKIRNNARAKHYKALQSQYNDNRVLKLLTTECEMLVDTADMIKSISSAHPTLNFLPKKPKTIQQIHDVCVRSLPKINQTNFDLCQREDILIFDGTKLNHELTILVPKTHFDLVDIGETLSFCIGNGHYSKNVRDNKSSIIAVADKKGLRWAVEFSRYRILNANGFANQRNMNPTSRELTELSALLLSKPKLQKDFLPILDCKWIHGYKYDNNDLYLLMNESIYVYFDVPHEVYEELLTSNSKGRFVNSTIKRNFAYERLNNIAA